MNRFYSNEVVESVLAGEEIIARRKKRGKRLLEKERDSMFGHEHSERGRFHSSRSEVNMNLAIAAREF